MDRRPFGDKSLRDMAVSHADKTLKHHFRPDFSSCHLVSYDTISGQPHLKQTHQGLSDSSAWSRGQAWGLYGYTCMYRLTGDARYLEQARGIAGFLINHRNMPADGFPTGISTLRPSPPRRATHRRPRSWPRRWSS